MAEEEGSDAQTLQRESRMRAIFTSALVATITSGAITGAFNLYSSRSTERLKQEFSTNQLKIGLLQEAQKALLLVDQQPAISISEAMQAASGTAEEQDRAIRILLKSMTEDFDKAIEVYINVKPALTESSRDSLEPLEEVAAVLNDQMRSRVLSEEDFDHEASLMKLLEARQNFIDSLKKYVGQDYVTIFKE